LVGPGEQYLCWLSGAGSMVGAPTFVSIGSVLPLSAAQAANIWTAAARPMAA
jgi:hypothetical protein